MAGPLLERKAKRDDDDSFSGYCCLFYMDYLLCTSLVVSSVELSFIFVVIAIPFFGVFELFEFETE